MKQIIKFFWERPLRSLVGLALIALAMIAGMNGMGCILAIIGAIVLTD